MWQKNRPRPDQHHVYLQKRGDRGNLRMPRVWRNQEDLRVSHDDTLPQPRTSFNILKSKQRPGLQNDLSDRLDSRRNRRRLSSLHVNDYGLYSQSTALPVWPYI